MIRTYVWSAGTAAPVEGGADTLPPSAAAPSDGSAVWVDLSDPTPEEEERVLGRFLPVHPLTYEDATRPHRVPEGGAHLPKVEEFAQYLLVIVNPLPAGLTKPPSAGERPHRLRPADRPQLTAVLTKTVLITHHPSPLACVDAGWEYVRRHHDCGGRGPDYLFHLVLDAMVDEYAPVVERLADRLDKVEHAIFTRPGPGQLHRLIRMKRTLSFVRKTLVLEREVLARLVRGEFALVSTAEVAYYRNVYDHLVRYAEFIESGRETVTDLVQTHLAAVSNRLNEVMKVLTMISTVVLPMTLIAGVYGMNFRKWFPELDWEYGYLWALGLMLLTGVGSFALFRWKKWI
jgi:magnesium transporter